MSLRWRAVRSERFDPWAKFGGSTALVFTTLSQIVFPVPLEFERLDHVEKAEHGALSLEGAKRQTNGDAFAWSAIVEPRAAHSVRIGDRAIIRTIDGFVLVQREA